jgi:hypothetical protein
MKDLFLSLLVYLTVGVGIGLITLLISMRLASFMTGGVDFGPRRVVISRGAILIALVGIINLVPIIGWLLGIVAWLVGLVLLYGINFQGALLLTLINGIVNLIVFAWLLTFLGPLHFR